MESINNWLVIVVLVYIILSIGNGYRKGFVKMIVSIVALFVVIMISRMVAPQVEKYLREETTVYEQIQNRTEDYVDHILEGKLQNGLF